MSGRESPIAAKDEGRCGQTALNSQPPWSNAAWIPTAAEVEGCHWPTAVLSAIRRRLGYLMPGCSEG
jgi:hypothetical protein